MIKPQDFYELLKKKDINFFSGVPDSLLKDICAFITDNTSSKRNIIAANEGNSVGLATGYYLATGKYPLVYMQNSGLGNIINPILSLADKEVYSIPMLLMIGWRGEPGIKDEPQHIKQGKVTLTILETLGIKYKILPNNFEEAKRTITWAIKEMKEFKNPVAIVVKKNTFEKYSLNSNDETFVSLKREEAIEIIVNHLEENDIIISTTGKASRELFEIRERKNQEHKMDFLTVGSMGHANQIALTVALENLNRQVYCLDGDGAILMHTGGMGIIGDLAPKNYKHIVINNGSHESVGGQPTIGFKVNFGQIAESFNYKKSFRVNNIEELNNILPLFISTAGPCLLEVQVSQGSRADLGRPTTSPIENKKQFMTFIQE